MDELEEFARWYESELKKLEDEKGIPLEKREKMGLVQQILESKKRILEASSCSFILFLDSSAVELNPFFLSSLKKFLFHPLAF